MKFQKIVFFIICVFLFSCDRVNEKLPTQKKYVDIKKIFEGQIVKLQNENPIVVKKININNNIESLNLSKLDWEKELEAFLKLDLANPTYANSFELKETAEGLTYTIIEGEKSPIKEITLKKSNIDGGYSEISAIVSDENLLFSWQKNISAYFENKKLIGYKILGSQKMVFFDAKKFEVEGKVNYK